MIFAKDGKARVAKGASLFESAKQEFVEGAALLAEEQKALEAEQKRKEAEHEAYINRVTRDKALIESERNRALRVVDRINDLLS